MMRRCWRWRFPVSTGTISRDAPSRFIVCPSLVDCVGLQGGLRGHVHSTFSEAICDAARRAAAEMRAFLTKELPL